MDKTISNKIGCTNLCNIMCFLCEGQFYRVKISGSNSKVRSTPSKSELQTGPPCNYTSTASYPDLWFQCYTFPDQRPHRDPGTLLPPWWIIFITPVRAPSTILIHNQLSCSSPHLPCLQCCCLSCTPCSWTKKHFLYYFVQWTWTDFLCLLKVFCMWVKRFGSNVTTRH